MVGFARVKKLSEANPQLWRELKARLKWRSVIVTIAASFLSQWLLMLQFQESWAGVLDQQELHRSAFGTLFWWGLFLLMTVGSYLLVRDMAREEKRGTLNFLRLTPEPSEKILIGKVLGVPILLYLAIVLAVPLHLITALKANLSSLSVLSGYVLAGSACGVAYSYSLLYVLSWKAKAHPLHSIAGVVFGYFAILLFWRGWLSDYEDSDLVLRSAVTLGGAALMGILMFACWELAASRLRHPLVPKRPQD